MTSAIPPDNVVGHEGPLAEFVALRQEIVTRLDAQQRLHTLQLTLSGAVLGFALSGAGRTGFLLILPLSSYMLFGRWAAQHSAIHECARYIDEVLKAKVPGGLHWESWIKSNPRPPFPLVGWLEPLLVTFPGVSFLALALSAPSVYFFGGEGAGQPTRIALVALWILGFVLALGTVRLLWYVRESSWLPRWRKKSQVVKPDRQSANPPARD